MPAPIPQNCAWVGGVSPADGVPALDADTLARDVALFQRSWSAPALYRTGYGEPWQDVELLSRTGNTFVLREVGKLWPGIIVASLDQVGFPGPVLEFREPFGNERRAA